MPVKQKLSNIFATYLNYKLMNIGKSEVDPREKSLKGTGERRLDIFKLTNSSASFQILLYIIE